ncbi:VOC family protein [Sphingomonas immobilis]|uniref:VOC family protein n=1 Tax=Sphingomonas immobilis TaxID=3063997 RepID=A0ABT8ZWS4_9SPHN|nr:VOC family protein [Sphingomonas sp. CA1-15]MDO7841713.1 VOC family protein [Sphingomonas sp. CA1-15]
MIDAVLAGLHPPQLFHVGVVAADIDVAMREMSASLGLAWKGGKAKVMDLCLYGQERKVEMRIAHSRQGPPHVEVIQAVPDSPWALPPATGVHHLCYWSEDSAAICARLEAAGNRRVLGKPSAPSGYFLSPSGMYVEIIDKDLHDSIAGWLARDS